MRIALIAFILIAYMMALGERQRQQSLRNLTQHQWTDFKNIITRTEMRS